MWESTKWLVKDHHEEQFSLTSPELSELRKSVLEMAMKGQEGHVPSSLSILEIVWTIYNGGFVKQAGPSKFVLSKGHGCLALYTVLSKKGWFPEEWLSDFAGVNSRLGGHPDRTLVPGVEASTGSLGHGMPFASGLAYSMRLLGTGGRTFVLVGDGEANEGTIWETALLAAHHKLSNLVCVVDQNSSSNRAVNLGSLSKKFDSFGWAVSEVNGHDEEAILEALSAEHSSPHAIIASTVKGKGFSEMENNPAWHHTKITQADFERFLRS